MLPIRVGSAFFALVLNGAFVLLLSNSTLAQGYEPGAGDTVAWSVQTASVTRDNRATLTLNATLQPGWHVYALKQKPGGPTPLLVTLDQNGVAAAGGPVSGTPATTFHDPAFGFDTQYYANGFSLTVPVRLNSHVSAHQAIPISVRFQTCNGRICEPPRTVRLSALVNLPTEK